MKEGFILALDQGTTSSRSLLVDRNGLIQADAQKEFQQIFPEPGWVEHDPLEIWDSQLDTINQLLSKASVSIEQIAAVGITNQRETTLVWDRKTGEPICNAIVWQDRRTAAYCDELIRNGKTELIQSKTGLVVDAYFSATKLKWILDHNPGSRKRAAKGELCFGTVDSWLIYKLSKGKSHITDVSNASRTMLFNINKLSWDPELLELFDIPEAMLPSVCESSGILSHVDTSLFGKKIPISGIAGDQQAALFGQMCVEPGMAKNTYGTGCFLLMNTGHTPVKSANRLLTTIAWTINGETNYALEGSVFVGGAAVQWIRDGLNLVDDASEIESLAAKVNDTGGVIFVPALTGLGAPHWDPYARGAILGLTRGTNKCHIALATLEGIAFQVCDIVKAMEEDSGRACKELRVDGGATTNKLLMQIQADLFGFEVIRAKIQETTALGAAYFAGLGVGFFESIESLKSLWSSDKIFIPEHSAETGRIKKIEQWRKAVQRSRNWSD